MNTFVGMGVHQRNRTRNLLKAVGIIAFLFVSVFLVEGIYAMNFPEEMIASSSQPQISLEAIMSDSDAPLGDIRGELPFGFEDEVLDLNDYSEVYVSETGEVVSFISTVDSEELFDICSERLCSKGWTRVESGHETAASFIKITGIFNWVFLDCIAAGNESSALIQVG